MKGAAAVLLATLAAGCVQGEYNRFTVDEPLRDEMVAPLRPGVDTLAHCLERLGAPHRVFEYRVGQDGSSGLALLWLWREVAGWGVDIDLSGVSDEASGSFSFKLADTDLPGCVLWFGPDLVLERWQRGTLGDLLPGRQRPSPQTAD